MNMANGEYHYTECGLDSVYLVGGFEFVDAPIGRQVVIHDIDGLHQAIGFLLVDKKKYLSGKELRFLRHEMLMSQATLARLLDVSEQAVRRWETGKTEQVPKPAEALIRLLYREHMRGNKEIRSSLQQIADLEDQIDKILVFNEYCDGWKAAA